MNLKPTNYHTFTVHHFVDGGTWQDSPHFSDYRLALARFITLTKQPGVRGVLLTGWLPTNEPHTLDEWDRDGLERKKPKCTTP